MAREAVDFRTCCLISCFSNFHMASVVPSTGLCQAGQLHCLWHFGYPAVSVSQPRTISIVSKLWEKYPQGKHRPKRRLLWGFPESELVERNTWQCELRLLCRNTQGWGRNDWEPSKAYLLDEAFWNLCFFIVTYEYSYFVCSVMQPVYNAMYNPSKYYG